MNKPKDLKASASHFIRALIEQDLPNPLVRQTLKTRFPPEPNGYLHIGHAKSICLNFGLAEAYGGICHLRLDDTNPEKESMDYVEAIIDAVQWLGFSWEKKGRKHLYFASDYYEQLYQFAERLIEHGAAYVDSQSPEEINRQRGTLTSPGQNSPHRERSPEESLQIFRAMRSGQSSENSHVLRAKIDMASPNMNMRDPVLYRVRFVEHYRTGRQWCLYPLYDYAHCISDALEGITHSLCTLEFEDHRPLYDWILQKLVDIGVLQKPLPRQIEFARLNLSHTVTSKRKLLQLVQQQHVQGWDDPRLPTLLGLRRRGFTSSSIRLFCERIGVAKADSWIDMDVLEQALRDDLEPKAPRLMAVLDPVKLVIENYPSHKEEIGLASVHPHRPELGQRVLPFCRELWIERNDFQLEPEPGFYRLAPGQRVRLRYAFVIECTEVERDPSGRVMTIYARYFPDSRSGTEGSNTYQVKGNIHWISAQHAVKASVHLYDRLFKEERPDVSAEQLAESLNPNSKRTVTAFLEPAASVMEAGKCIQFERQGYFVTDSKDSLPEALVFNRVAPLKNSWAKISTTTPTHQQHAHKAAQTATL